MRTFVFLGPSLPLAEASALCDAVFLPPAAAGDVYRLIRDLGGPARVAIVDGYFERMAAVWHKEILFALGRRVAVYGAASMGAIRAAELDRFGMIGVGQVYRAYAAGRLTCDDEVAIAHAPEERGYAAASDAMVNLRAMIGALHRRRAIDRRERDALVALGRARFYRERSVEQLCADARAAGLARAARALAAAPRRDVKAADARLLLRTLARTPPRRPPAPRWAMAETYFWRRFTSLIDEE